jgi:tetratricopeptide (TPR) repeat protein
LLYIFFREALNLRGDCAHINIRCAKGFSKLPFPYRDLELAKECCDKALALAPNNAMANHVAGSIYDWYERDVEKAKKHYKMAGEQGSYGAYLDLYKLKFNEVIIVYCMSKCN